MIPIDYELKVGDKLIMNEAGKGASYGNVYVEDCVSGVIITSIIGIRYTYTRIDGKPCQSTDGSPWSSVFREERRSHFDLIIDKPYVHKSRLQLVLE